MSVDFVTIHNGVFTRLLKIKQIKLSMKKNHPKILRLLLTLIQVFLVFYTLEHTTFLNILLFIMIGVMIEDVKDELKSTS